jgi:Zn-dependent M32 family carboxypeptidase
MASLPDRLGSFDTSLYKSVDLANAYNESLWKGAKLKSNFTLFEKKIEKRCRLNTGTSRYPLTDGFVDNSVYKRIC